MEAFDRTARGHLRTGDKAADRNANPGFCDNELTSTKYSLLSFLPRNLFEQFMRVANFYFLVMMCIALVPDLSPTAPIVSVLPLLFVITVTMAKQGYEDYLRHCADRAINLHPARVMASDTRLFELPTQEIRVGDLVNVLDGEAFPCDMVLLTSSSTDGNCTITTTNLDGETALKTRAAPTATRHLVLSEFDEVDVTIRTGTPIADLYQFTAIMDATDRRTLLTATRTCSMTTAMESSSLPIDTTHLLLKGARLKGTASVLGLAVMTGKQTKLAMNQRPIAHKSSSAEKRLNGYILLLLGLMFVSCSFSVVYQHYSEPFMDNFYPLHPLQATMDVVAGDAGVCTGAAGGWVGRLEIKFCEFLQFMILYSFLVPIALYVTLELQKMVGALIIGWDLNMYDPDLDEPAVARTSDLNEELALVEHIFADKTGTLTENVMAFQRCSVKGCVYNYVARTKSIEPATTQSDPQALFDCFFTLAVCNTIQVNMHKVRIEGHDELMRTYSSSSPDEEALVSVAACEQVGVELLSRTSDILELGIRGKVQKLKILHVCEFESIRMRMSVIAQDEAGQVTLHCKGADGAILPRIRAADHATDHTTDHATADRNDTIERTQRHLHQFSRAGLRTMAVARRSLSKAEADKIMAQLDAATALIAGRNERLSDIYDEIEQGMEFLGVTAVEDKLQDGVETAMRKLREAGCRLWVLTGDKKETAMSISLSSAHTSDDMKMFDATGYESAEECRDGLAGFLRTLQHDRSGRHSTVAYSYSETGVGGRKTPAADKETGRYGHALVIDGQSVALALEHCGALFFELATGCASVLGCRLSPLQKALVVRMVRAGGCADGNPQLRTVTLAIGDGANDVAMIREADIGVGVMGKEGREAANSSDFAIGKFRHLAPLLLVHGHLCYVRTRYTILYFFYKDVAICFPLFLFGFDNLFSSQPLFDSWMIMLYNMVFTAAPVLFYGMFEMDLSYDELLDNPELHKDFTKNKQLSFGKFFLWMLNGLVHGATAYYGMMFALSTTPFSRDTEVDLIVFGLAVFTTIFVVVNVRIAMDTRSWFPLTHLGMWVMTFGSYLLFLVVYTAVPDIFGKETTSGVYWSAFRLFGNARIWSAMVILSVFGILLDLFISFLRRTVWPTRVNVLQLDDWRRRAANNRACPCFAGCDSHSIQDTERKPLMGSSQASPGRR